MSSKGKDDACTKVLKYLEEQNRPYSVVDILNNLHKAVGKSAIVKALETLVADGVVREKTYGKQKVYVYNQENVPAADKAELQDMDRQIASATDNSQHLQSELNQLTAKHKALANGMTLGEAQNQLAAIHKECDTLREKLSKLRSGKVLVTKEERHKIHTAWTGKVKAWRKRKRMATDILEAILENYPKPKKALFEDIGIETDEECKVSIPAV